MRKLAVFVLIAVAFAAEKPLPEVSNLRLVNTYQSAIIAQAQFMQAQTVLNQALLEYHATEAAEAKANGLPEGTTFSVDLVTKKATAVLPKKEDKPEVKK